MIDAILENAIKTGLGRDFITFRMKDKNGRWMEDKWKIKINIACLSEPNWFSIHASSFFSPLTSCQWQFFSFKNSELRAIYEAPFVGSGFKRMMSYGMQGIFGPYVHLYIHQAPSLEGRTIRPGPGGQDHEARTMRSGPWSQDHEARTMRPGPWPVSQSRGAKAKRLSPGLDISALNPFL